MSAIQNKASSLINRFYARQQNILPRKLTPESLGVFLTGQIQSKKRYVGFSSHIFRDMFVEMIQTNMIAGTDGQKMFIGAPIFSTKWWQEEMFIEDPTIELAVAFVYGLASHEAGHCLVFSKDKDFTNVPAYKQKVLEYVKINTSYYFDESLALKIASLVEDIIVEEYTLRKTEKFKPYIPYLNIALSVTFSIARLQSSLAKCQDIKQVLSELAFFTRNKEMAVSSLIFESQEVQEMDEILSNAGRHGSKVRNETVLELYDYILRKEEEDKQQQEQEKQSGNDENEDEKEEDEEKENDSENQDNSDTQNNSQEEDESQGNNRISEKGKQELDEKLGTDIASQTPSNNQSGQSESLMDSGFANEMTEKEIKALMKAIEKAQNSQEMKALQKEMQIWQDVIRSTETFDKRSQINDALAERNAEINKYTPKFLEQMKQVAESFKQLKTKKRVRTLYQKQGDIDGDSLDGIFSGDVFENKLSTANRKRRAKVVIVIDNSGSTDSHTNNIGYGMVGHLRSDLYSCAYSIFELLSNAGYPVTAISHTTDGGGVIYNIASYEMPMVGGTDIVNTYNNEQRFNNVFQNSETNYNADGWVLQEAVKVLKNHPMTGDDIVIFLSDGQPSAAPHGDARQFFVEQIENARQEKTLVVGLAATKDVVPALQTFFGERYTYDISDENMGEVVSKMLEEVISAY